MVLTGIIGFLLVSAFVKVFTTLTIFRYGLGLTNCGFGVVIAAVSLALSILIASPQIEKIGGMDQFFRSMTFSRFESEFRPFMEKNTDEATRSHFSNLKIKTETVATPPVTSPALPVPAAQGTASFPLTILMFLLSQLKDAFTVGCMILLPFLVIDLIVTNVLMVLGITQIHQQVVSLPLKLILFISIDGWTLLADKIVNTYAG